jgi:hypothetical protein
MFLILMRIPDPGVKKHQITDPDHQHWNKLYRYLLGCPDPELQTGMNPVQIGSRSDSQYFFIFHVQQILFRLEDSGALLRDLDEMTQMGQEFFC